jgi:hypothetical protein
MHVKLSEGPEGLWRAARCLISFMYVHASPGFLQPSGTWYNHSTKFAAQNATSQPQP